MDYPLPDPPYYEPEPYYQPEPVLVRHDRLAVAIGNASLLGVGYLLLGRRAWAFVTTLVTIVLLVLLGTAIPGVWFEVLFVVWWIVLIAHGWYLARIPARPAPVRWPRVVALVIAVPVVAGLGYVRFDAAGIEDTITEARDDGDCGKAQSALDKIWFGHYVVNGPMAARSERTAQACIRLRQTKDSLTDAASRLDTQGLQKSYSALNAVLTDLPGHDKMVGTVLDGFVGSLSGRNPCDIAELTDWVRKRPASNNLLDRSADVVPRIAPAALVSCGDDLSGRTEWRAALARYQQLLDQYPGHELTAKANEGAAKAKVALELQHVKTLGARYCDTPAPYSAAAPYAKGAANVAVVYGGASTDGYPKQIPGEWQTSAHEKAVQIVCLGTTGTGAGVKTCPYRKDGERQITNVTFTKIAVPVKAYELRTGNLVFDGTVEISGATCPPMFFASGLALPTQRPVSPADNDVRAAFAPVFTP